MKFLRRILGILVMIAGILGLVISLAGLVGIWMVKPTVVGFANSTIVTLNDSVNTSQKAMEIAVEALGASGDSIDALSEMLGATATSVESTQPVLDQINTFMGEELPSTLESATSSLKTAQQAADVLDGAIKSLDSFRSILSTNPLLSAFIQLPEQSYNPEVPLADSLGEVAANLEGLPDMFTEMAANLDKADDNLANIQSSLTTMSDSVALISKSLREYQTMIGQSKSSMGNLRSMLTNVQNNLESILNGVVSVLSLFFLWLLAAQVVILSQGWELFKGTAGRMEGGATEPSKAELPTAEPPAADVKKE